MNLKLSIYEARALPLCYSCNCPWRLFDEIGLLPLLRVPELAATCSGWSTSTRWIRHSSNSFASSQPGTNGDNKKIVKKSDTVDKTFVFRRFFFVFTASVRFRFFHIPRNDTSAHSVDSRTTVDWWTSLWRRRRRRRCRRCARVRRPTNAGQSQPLARSVKPDQLVKSCTLQVLHWILPSYFKQDYWGPMAL